MRRGKSTWPGRTGAALLVGWTASLVAPILGAPEVAGLDRVAPADDASMAGDVPPLSNLVFGPGTWRGRAIGTGLISAAGGDAFASEPFVIDFEFGVRADGTVEAGVWQWSGEIAVATEAGSGVLQMDGSGPLEGNGARVVITGTIHMSGR